MDQKIFDKSPDDRLQRIDKKFGYLTSALVSDGESRHSLQVFHGNSDFGLESSLKKAQRQGRRQESDDEEGRTSDEMLIQISMDQSTEVKELDLSSKRISFHNATTLIKILSSFQNLQLLNLSSNCLSDFGIGLLSSNKNKRLALLEQLNLADNQFGKEGAKSLSLNVIWENLKLLDLSNNPFGSEGVKFIAQNAAWSALQVLVLKDIGLDQNGAKALAANESWERLQELHLDGNPELGDQGLLALTYNKVWIHLQKLSICDCGIKSSA